MTLPAFADLDALGARVPEGISSGSEARAQAALDDAAALIRDEAGGVGWATAEDPGDDVPGIIPVINLRSALRSYLNPEGNEQESTGEWAAKIANASSDVYLTASEIKRVQRAAGRAGVWVQPTTRGRPETDTVFLDVEPAGERIPWDVTPGAF